MAYYHIESAQSPGFVDLFQQPVDLVDLRSAALFGVGYDTATEFYEVEFPGFAIAFIFQRIISSVESNASASISESL